MEARNVEYLILAVGLDECMVNDNSGIICFNAFDPVPAFAFGGIEECVPALVVQDLFRHPVEDGVAVRMCLLLQF